MPKRKFDELALSSSIQSIENNRIEVFECDNAETTSTHDLTCDRQISTSSINRKLRKLKNGAVSIDKLDSLNGKTNNFDAPGEDNGEKSALFAVDSPISNCTFSPFKKKHKANFNNPINNHNHQNYKNHNRLQQQPSNTKRVTYGAVTVYYFQRSQGFSCVPTSGGSTLGMSRKHYACRSMKLSEHQVEIQRYRQSCLEQQRRSQLLFNHQQQQQRESHMITLSGLPPDAPQAALPNNEGPICVTVKNPSESSSYHCFETQSLTNGNGQNLANFSNYREREEGLDEENEDFEAEDEEDEGDDEDEDEEDLNSDSDPDPNPEDYTPDDQLYRNGDLREPVQNDQRVSRIGQVDILANGTSSEDDYVHMPDEYFLQPLDSKQRRAMLRNLGIQVDRSERDECQAIRLSRQKCGCNCRGGQCLPETCACAVDEIKCQVDRPTFPCSCTLNGCKNLTGRVEFNAVRVRTHFLNTMMRVKFLGDQQDHVPSPVHTRFDTESDYKTTYLERRETKTAPNFGEKTTKNGQNCNLIYINCDPDGKINDLCKDNDDNGVGTGNCEESVVTCSSLQTIQLESLFSSEIRSDWSLEKLNGDESDFYERRTDGSGSTASTESAVGLDAFLDKFDQNEKHEDGYHDGVLSHVTTTGALEMPPTTSYDSSYILATLYSRPPENLASPPSPSPFHYWSRDTGDASRDLNKSVNSTAIDDVISADGLVKPTTYSLASLYPHQQKYKYSGSGQLLIQGQPHQQQQRALLANCQDQFLEDSCGVYFSKNDATNYNTEDTTVLSVCYDSQVHDRCGIDIHIANGVSHCRNEGVCLEDENSSGGCSLNSCSSSSLASSSSVSAVSSISSSVSSNNNSNNSFLPSSPAELSAVLKKSICESVLA